MDIQQARGSLNGPWYLENAQGHILLPVSESNARTNAADPRYADYEVRQARTLDEVKDLQKRMQEQERKQNEFELARDRAVCAAGREMIRQRLIARRNHPDCPPFERDTIDEWLATRETGARKRKYIESFTKADSFFPALEFDNGGLNHCLEVADRSGRT